MIPEKLQLARIRAMAKAPYLNAALWAVRFVESEDMPQETLGIDKWWRVYWHPKAVEKWSVEELSAVLYHEVGHPTRGHAERAELQGVDVGSAMVWNVAADCEINDGMPEGLVLPADCVHPKQFAFPEGLLAEEYWDRLFSEGKVKTVCIGCGSGADGQEHGWELGNGDGEDGNSSGLSKMEGDLVRKMVAEDVRKHVGRGTVPADWVRWADGILLPAKVPWQRELMGEVKKVMFDVAGMADFSYRKVSRRQEVADLSKVILPTLRQPMPHVCVVVDTSGSMGSGELEAALAEVQGILQVVMHEVVVLAVDAAVHTTQKVFKASQAQLIGGGGTDMRVGLERASELRPDVCVCITDGYTPWPQKMPMRLIVVLVGGGNGPDWGKTIKVC